MVSFKTAITNTDKEKTTYEITFTTDNKEYYEKVQEECRRCIDLSSKRLSQECKSKAEKLFRDLGYTIRQKEGNDIVYIREYDNLIIYLDSFNKVVSKYRYNRFDGTCRYYTIDSESEREAVKKQIKELHWYK